MRTFVVKDPLLSIVYQLPSGKEILFDATSPVSVSGDDLAYLKLFVPFQNLLQVGSIVEIDGAIAPESLKDLSFEAIVVSISSCYDIGYLEAYLATSTAPLVRDTIVRRLRELQSHIESVILAVPAPTWDTFNPTQSSLPEIKEAIAQCDDPDVLASWLPEVSRRTQGLINAKIKTLVDSPLSIA